MTTVPKIGACCMWLDPQTGEQLREMNFRATTVKYISGLSRVERSAYLGDIVAHNLKALRSVVETLSAMPPALRMWRIGSGVLPVYTHKIARDYYRGDVLSKFIAPHLAKTGQIARKHGVRLSFHPDQFVVLGSHHKHVRENSVREFEYHAQVAEWMGYTGWHQDGFSINVHVGGKQVEPKVLRRTIQGMSQTAQNLITLENDEFTTSAKRIVDAYGDIVPLVLDIHHYWIMRGQRVRSEGPHIEYIKQTWCGVRPKLHLAMSHSHLIPKPWWTKPLDLQPLLDSGLTKGALRAHSSMPWHKPTLDYALEFLPEFDLQWEGGDKTVGQHFIARYAGLV